MTGKNTYSLTVNASTHHLSEVRDFVATHATEFGFSDPEISDIRLAVDEAYTNIIKHAYKYDKSQNVEISLGYKKGRIWISLVDNGNSFDPETYSDPNIKRQVKEKRRGGVGVYLIRELMDEVEYLKKGDGNEIRIYKNKRS